MAILIGVGFVAGVVTTSLRQMTRRSDSVIATAQSSEPSSLDEEVSESGEKKSVIQGVPPENPKALAYERLSQLERFKSGFLARTAHELRSPINSVIGLHQLILEGLCESPEEEKQFTGEAKEAAYKVLQLFDTIIAASKLDIGREVPTLESIALATLFKTLKELTQLQAANSNLRLTFKPTELSVVSDLKWLQMMLISLIDDAITSTKLGDITLDAIADGEFVVLSIEADRPVSELCVRLDTSLYGREVDLSNLSSVYISTGLTLAVAQEMVTALKGELILPTEEDTSIIKVKLPAG
ncbi:MAG: HAMP domain-containing histidine kinase [Leptolyngbya sp. SIO3F4]|nr:HAMP domain-containing histidine kinase [Leptolyngbya sp. SIO3F4]